MLGSETLYFSIIINYKKKTLYIPLKPFLKFGLKGNKNSRYGAHRIYIFFVKRSPINFLLEIFIGIFGEIFHCRIWIKK